MVSQHVSRCPPRYCCLLLLLTGYSTRDCLINSAVGKNCKACLPGTSEDLRGSQCGVADKANHESGIADRVTGITELMFDGIDRRSLESAMIIAFPQRLVSHDKRWSKVAHTVSINGAALRC